jgi:hypothetical protein
MDVTAQMEQANLRRWFAKGFIAVFVFLLGCVGLAAPAGAATIAVWVGSPVDGHWPTNSDSLPASHHRPYLGDWSVDLQGVGVGQPVHLYAAPQNGHSPVSARVETVGPACASRDLADGGYQVTVGIYNGSTKVGKVTYAHIQPRVSAGQSINRWGTVLGTVGSYRWNRCWQKTHLHYEMYSQQNYACYNKGYTPGYPIRRANFLGFMGGNYASAPRGRCP